MGMAAEPAAARATDAEVWETEADADVVPQLHLPERLLSQDEIDCLLGRGRREEDLAGRTGVRAIVDSQLVSNERPPMLEIALDRLVRLMKTSLRNFTSDNVEVSLDQIASIRFGDYLDSIAQPSIVAVLRAEQLDKVGLVTVDHSLVHSIVDVLLGGRCGVAPTHVEGRPYPTIERMLATRMIEVVLADARQALAPLTDVEFRLDRIETDPRFAAIARPSDAAILVKLRIDLEDRGGRLELLLPLATFEPIRKRGEKLGRDTKWEGRLASELLATKLEVRAVLDELTQPLRKVLDLKVGDTLMLDAPPDAQVKLKCGAVDLSVGRVGRLGHSLAVRVERPIAPAAQHAVMRLGGGS